MEQSEAAEQLREVRGTIEKIGTETDKLLEKITELEQAAADADNVSPELMAAIEAVKVQANVVDEKVPDLPPDPGATGKK